MRQIGCIGWAAFAIELTGIFFLARALSMAGVRALNPPPPFDYLVLLGLITILFCGIVVLLHLRIYPAIAHWLIKGVKPNGQS